MESRLLFSPEVNTHFVLLQYTCADDSKTEFSSLTNPPLFYFIIKDNCSSLVGMGASEPGKIVISLGTSDTFFAAMPNVFADPNGV
jgi:hypothetical protein